MESRKSKVKKAGVKDETKQKVQWFNIFNGQNTTFEMIHVGRGSH